MAGDNKKNKDKPTGVTGILSTLGMVKKVKEEKEVEVEVTTEKTPETPLDDITAVIESLETNREEKPPVVEKKKFSTPVATQMPKLHMSLYLKILEIVNKAAPTSYQTFLQQLELFKKVSALSDELRIQTASVAANVSRDELLEATSRRKKALEETVRRYSNQIQAKKTQKVSTKAARVSEIDEKITELQKEKASLAAEIQSDERQLENLEQSLQTVFNKISEEIETEQQNIKNHLK